MTYLLRYTAQKLLVWPISNVDSSNNHLPVDIEEHIFSFSTFIRPILEINKVIWSPHTLRDFDEIENVQRKFIKFLLGLFNVLLYMNRLEIVGLQSLEI